MLNVMEMSFEQFCDGMEKVMAKFGVKLTDQMVSELLIYAYNKYRELVAEGQSLEELEPFFNDVAKKLYEAVKK